MRCGGSFDQASAAMMGRVERPMAYRRKFALSRSTPGLIVVLRTNSGKQILSQLLFKTIMDLMEAAVQGESFFFFFPYCLYYFFLSFPSSLATTSSAYVRISGALRARKSWVAARRLNLERT